MKISWFVKPFFYPSHNKKRGTVRKLCLHKNFTSRHGDDGGDHDDSSRHDDEAGRKMGHDDKDHDGDDNNVRGLRRQVPWEQK